MIQERKKVNGLLINSKMMRNAKEIKKQVNRSEKSNKIVYGIIENKELESRKKKLSIGK